MDERRGRYDLTTHALRSAAPDNLSEANSDTGLPNFSTTSE